MSLVSIGTFSWAFYITTKQGNYEPQNASMWLATVRYGDSIELSVFNVLHELIYELFTFRSMNI